MREGSVALGPGRDGLRPEPVRGCEHGCIYCYAPGHTHSDLSTWRVVRVKRNVADRLSKELPFADGTIGIGTVTDPYQAAERRFRLTRSCLEILRENDREVHIHTKSDLVLRDMDILGGMRCVVGMTVTTADDRSSKMTEPGAPLPSARLEALGALLDAGVDAYALVAPVMSSLEGREADLADGLATTGVRDVFIEGLNTRLVDMTRMDRMRITHSVRAEAELARQCLGRGLTVNGRSG